jgi:Peroxiredoxin
MSVLVGKQAPDFTVPAVLGNGEIVDSFNLASAIKGKYGLVFFYPLDFTFVCPSELIALDNRIPDFQARNVEVIGVSIDSHFTHNAWRNTPVNAGGIGQVKYTLAADITHEICKAYDVESEGGVAFRGAFLIDTNGVVVRRSSTTCHWAVTWTSCCVWSTPCNSTKSTAKSALPTGRKATRA